MKARVFQGRERLWYFRILFADGSDTIAESRPFRRRKDAVDAVNLISSTEFVVEVDVPKAPEK